MKSAFTGTEIFRVPFVDGAWSQSDAEVVYDLGRRAVWELRFDAPTRSVYLVADEGNDGVWNVYRFDVERRALTKVSNVFWTIGYDFDPTSRYVVVTGQIAKDGPFCIQRIHLD